MVAATPHTASVISEATDCAEAWHDASCSNAHQTGRHQKAMALPFMPDETMDPEAPVLGQYETLMHETVRFQALSNNVTGYNPRA